MGAYGLTLRHYADASIVALPYTNANTTVGKFDDWDVQVTDNNDVAYLLNLPDRAVLKLTTCNAAFDSKIEIFYENGSPTGFYNDDGGPCSNFQAAGLTNVTLPKGKYYVVVDGYNSEQGNFTLEVTTQPVGAKVSAEMAALLDQKARNREILAPIEAVIRNYQVAAQKSQVPSRIALVDQVASGAVPVRGADLIELEKAASGGNTGTGEFDLHGVPDAKTSMEYEAQKSARISQGHHPIFIADLGNPRSPSLILDLPSRGKVRLVLCDLAGKEVAVLANRDFESGRHSISLEKFKGAKGMHIMRLRSEFGNLDRMIAPF